MNSFESKFKRPMWFLAVALSALMVGCGGDDDEAAPAPTPVDDPVGAVCTQGTACVPLGTAGNYTILTQNGATTTGTTAITGHVASAAAASSTTGFSETLAADGTFATSALVIGGGRMYAFDYAIPTPDAMTQAITDAGAAFTNVDDAIIHPVGLGNTDVGRVGGPVGNITGMDLAPGVYEWTAANVVIDAPGVTLTGGPTAVWIFRTPGGMTMNSGATVTLAGGALPQNVFWSAAGVVSLIGTANLKGIVLSGSSVTMTNGASVTGRLIATDIVTLIANTVTRPPAP